MLEAIQSHISIILALIAIILAFITFGALYCNWLYLFLWMLKKKSHSPVIFLAQITGVIALLIYPYQDLTSYWWVPIALDIPSFFLIPSLIRAIVDIRNSK